MKAVPGRGVSWHIRGMEGMKMLSSTLHYPRVFNGHYQSVMVYLYLGFGLEVETF